MTKTLILLFHPDLKRSKANAALAGAAAKLDGVEVADMQAAYPDSMDMFRDGEREARRLLAADRIVLQFPIQWYSTPPLMKAWQDAVLTRMFYVTYETEGRALEGTPLMLAATAGNARIVPPRRAQHVHDGGTTRSFTRYRAPLRAQLYRAVHHLPGRQTRGGRAGGGGLQLCRHSQELDRGPIGNSPGGRLSDGENP